MRLWVSLLFLLLSQVALAQDPLSDGGAQYLTVRVEGAPPSTAVALLDLNTDLRGLQLRSEGEGVWTGDFVMLPGMVPGLVRPEVHLFDKAQLELPGVGNGVSVELASSLLDQEGLAIALTDRRALFVFGASIDAASISFKTKKGYTPPAFSHHTFSLPGMISPDNVSAIFAETTEGVGLSFYPDWTSDAAVKDDGL